MPYIFCCNQKRICDAYKLENLPGLILNYAYFVEACPSCGHTVLVLRRYAPDGSVSEVRKKNEAARKLFDKVRCSIICKLPKTQEEQGGKSFLRYNAFGVIKKCYSNLSSLKMGLFDPPGLDLPRLPEKLEINSVRG